MKWRGKITGKLKELIKLLVHDHSLPEKHHDHTLIGHYINHKECHIESDWLLIYKKNGGTLFLERTGSHSDLFN